MVLASGHRQRPPQAWNPITATPPSHAVPTHSATDQSMGGGADPRRLLLQSRFPGQGAALLGEACQLSLLLVQGDIQVPVPAQHGHETWCLMSEQHRPRPRCACTCLTLSSTSKHSSVQLPSLPHLPPGMDATQLLADIGILLPDLLQLQEDGLLRCTHRRQLRLVLGHSGLALRQAGLGSLQLRPAGEGGGREDAGGRDLPDGRGKRGCSPERLHERDIRLARRKGQIHWSGRLVQEAPWTEHSACSSEGEPMA